MQKKLIDELYYGNIDPSAKGIVRGSDYDKTNKKFVKLYDDLNSKLKDKEKKTLESLVEHLMKLNSIDCKDKFKEGFSLGLRLTAESFIDKSENFKDL